MNFDELGSGLGSLSLDERARYDDSSVSDAMEIDVDDSSVPDSDPEPEEHDEGNSSLIKDIFSPTSLGARYALKPMKLLMPPPDHDYEFDTSQSLKISGELVRHRKAPAPSPSPFAGLSYTPPGPASSPAAGAASGFSSGPGFAAMPEPFRFPYSQVAAPQVHHHHYYANTEVGFPRGAVQPAAAPQKVQPYVGPSTVSKKAHAESSRREFLPLPWDPRAVPADRMPYVLSSYLQLVVNVVLSGYAVHIVIVMVQTVRQDVAHKMALEAKRIGVQIASCERAYLDNLCGPGSVVPALEDMCSSLERCMAQDPLRGGNWASVSAHTVGHLVNSLIEPLSFKVLAVATFAVVLVFACNFGFGYVRAKAYYGWRDGPKTVPPPH